MKKKVFSVLLALVLALSLCLVTATPVMAGTAAGLIFIGDGIAEWSTEQLHSGTYSVKLQTTPPDWGNWAGLQIPYGNSLSTFITTGDGDDAVLDVSQTNFYYHMEGGVQGQVPIMALVFENMGTGAQTWKLILAPPIQPTPTGTGAWIQMLDPFTTGHLWRLDPTPREFDATYTWGTTPLYEELGWWQTNAASPIKGETVAYVELSIGTQAAIVYIDDVMINGVTYDLEPATGTVGVTASYEIAPPPVIGISVDEPSVDFGAVIPGVPAASTPSTVTVANTGDIDVDLSASIEDESPSLIYTASDPNGLTIGGTHVSTWTGSAAVNGDSGALTLLLTVPSGTPPDAYTAILVFWAEAVTLP